MVRDGARATVLAGLVVTAAALAAAGPPSVPHPQLPAEVIRYSGTDKPLEGRLAWALAEAPKCDRGRGVWIGYSVRRLMGEHSMIGSWSDDRTRSTLTITEILAGKREAASLTAGEDSVRRTAKDVLESIENKKQERKIWKDIGILCRYDFAKPAVLDAVRMSNLDLSFDFEDRPLVWIGGASDEESLAAIKQLFDESRRDKVRENLIAAAGVHGSPALVIPFLEKILTGKDSEHLRKEAAFWIGEQDDASGLRILVRAAQTDASHEVREGAVFAISQVSLPEAVDELIALARGASQADVRKQSVFWLGQIASKKAGAALEDFARNGGSLEIQEQAVFALSELPDNQGLEPLIKLAKTHPDPRIRKKAVFWLGESKDPRALQTLVDIIKGK